MVKSPVGPPGVPPVPTVGAWLRGSLPGRKVCAVAADSRIKVASAAKSALLASLIAFLLRNEFKFCGRGRPCSPKSPRRPCALDAACCVRPAVSPLAASGQPFESWGAGAPTTSVNPLSQRNCYRPRTRTSCRWSGAARGASDAWWGARRAILQCLYSASQLSELCALFGAPAYTERVRRCQHFGWNAFDAAEKTLHGQMPGAYQVPPDHTPLSRGNQEFF